MTASPRALPTLAALLGMISVAAAAFGAHGVADPHAKMLLRTGGEYGMVHALAVYAALFMVAQGRRCAVIAAWLFLAGGTLFCLSLDLLALTGTRLLGLITPIGGAAMIAGWVALAVAGVLAPKA